MPIHTCALALLTCPICGDPLHAEEKTLRCEHAHSFDIAREGYVSLLRKQASGGDTKEMLKARRAFLERDYYAPLAQTLTDLLAAHLHKRSVEQTSPLTILDAGCGNGYYLGSILHQLPPTIPSQSLCALGLDLSKEAIRMAAKSYPDAQFIVASLWERLVLVDASIQVMLNIFAPRNAPEYARVLAPDGLLLIVIPGPHHLSQVRAELGLLNIEEQKQQHILEQFAADFTLLEQRELAYQLTLDQDSLRQLVRMTPNYWHMTESIEQHLSTIDSRPCDIQFHCLLLQKYS
ncbi:putative RNA methyltransferase [Ktedonobacter racemifer]|uniref:rRNA (Guanine-N(1)-)-methyltransferase n=1 Tax=Ktedonobacter racemifer DSM 44963 TaxID=485913 RepID=D6TP99_KTERA|nr:methyltransferase domain-containing protein [Ktedonobacter racemifer]EFH87455.1 rRNA (guanine-N(1)-)-methyltransferase [Ktedonobacter racemifer DSM 44963]